jgi:hypothetical protein
MLIMSNYRPQNVQLGKLEVGSRVFPNRALYCQASRLFNISSTTRAIELRDLIQHHSNSKDDHQESCGPARYKQPTWQTK